MNGSRHSASEENPTLFSSTLRPVQVNLSKRFYKLAPGGKWYQRSVTGGYLRIKSKNAILQLQTAMNAKLARPE